MPERPKRKVSLRNAMSTVLSPLSGQAGFIAFLGTIAITAVGTLAGIIWNDEAARAFDEETGEQASVVYEDKLYHLTDDDTVETRVENIRTRYNFAAKVRIKDTYLHTITEHTETNPVLETEVTRFENIDTPCAAKEALKAGLKISENLKESFENAGDAHWILFGHGKGERKSLYDDALEFQQQYHTLKLSLD